MGNKTAIIFLTNTPQQGTIDFAEKIANETEFEVFIVADSNYVNLQKTGKVNYIQVSDYVCKKSGYVGCNIDGKSTHIQKEVIAYDKFLYAFCQYFTDFDYHWVFEDDVFIPSVDTIKNLNKEYSAFDLATPNHFKKTNNALDWHWKHIVGKIEPPYYYSMVCAMGISRRLIEAVKKYVEGNNSLLHIEAFFNTLAMQSGFSVVTPFELKSICWQGSWSLDEWILLPDNCFHPLKQISDHESYRNLIQKAKDANYIPENNLPPFITDLM